MDRYDIIAAITAKLEKAKDKTIILDINDDEDCVYLFNGDTEEQAGEMFRIVGFTIPTINGANYGGAVIVDCDGDANWSLHELTDYELGLIWAILTNFSFKTLCQSFT